MKGYRAPVVVRDESLAVVGVCCGPAVTLAGRAIGKEKDTYETKAIEDGLNSACRG